MNEPNHYIEGSMQHEIVKALQSINKFLRGDTALRDSVINGRTAWRFVEVDETD